MIEAKPWYKSRTIIFNAIMAMLVSAEASFSILQTVLPANWYGILSFALTVGNVVLRVITTSPVTSPVKRINSGGKQ